MRLSTESRMRGNSSGKTVALSPGVWSTDEYIRRWALRQGMTAGECVVPLQSLHDKWIARIYFNRKGQPVERLAVATQSDSDMLVAAT